MKPNFFNYISRLVGLLAVLLTTETYGQGNNIPPNISYNVPSSITVGTSVYYESSNTGGLIYWNGYVGRIAGNVNVPLGTNMTGPAIDAGIGEISAMTSDGQGGIYLFDCSVFRMYHISEDGQMRFLAGDGVNRVQDGIGTSASFGLVWGMARDGLGNIYFCEVDHDVIRKMTPSGVVTTIAGSVGQSGYVDGPAASARFYRPGGITVDDAGNIYVLDTENSRVRKITASGMVSTLAGNGLFESIDGPAATASLDLYGIFRSNGIAVDAQGNVYVSEPFRWIIRKITPDGTVSTYAGLRSLSSSAPRSGSRLSIRLEDPGSLTIDRSTGDLYVMNYDGIVTKINAETGMATTVLGGGSVAVQEGVPLGVGYSFPVGLICLEDGSLVVEDVGSGDGYHSCLYRYERRGFSIEPALPDGLTLGDMGTISGKSFLTHPHTNYTITARNPWGSHTYALSFAVDFPPGGPPGLDTSPPAQLAATAGQNYILETTYKSPNSWLMGSNNPVDSVERNIVYYDGLGRPIQRVQWQGSPNKKDIVQHTEYDLYGREVIKYLPYAEHTGSNGAFRGTAKASQQTFYSSMGWDDAVHKTAYPFAHTAYELNTMTGRPLQQGAPGAAWQFPANRHTVTQQSFKGHTATMEYSNNVTGEVRLWRINLTGSGATGLQYYVSATLYKTVTRDENWQSAHGKSGTVEEFRNLQDRIVLKRVWSDSSEALDTYYVYDIYGNLRYVIPPGYTGTSLTDGGVGFDEYIYAYRYDQRNRLVEKKLPGKDWEYIIYNRNDQPVLTQDAVQRSKSPQEWAYSKYDAFGRVTESGIYSHSYTDRTAAQTALDSYWNSSTVYWERRTDSTYSNVTFPNISLTPLIVNYYDDYGFEGGYKLPYTSVCPSSNTITLVTGLKVYKDDGTAPLLTVNYYDDRARLIQSASQNHLWGTDYVTNTYSFIGELLSSQREHKASTGATTTLLTSNSYDHVGRLLATKHKINAQDEVTLVKNEYNELGQLKRKSVGGNGQQTSFQDSTTYVYNERGWITSVTSPHFAYNLNYDKPTQGAVAQYNGNISEQHWTHKNQPAQYFTYGYDKLNRLTDGNSVSGNMREQLEYDVMGNIIRLIRDNHETGTSYSYTGHQLKSLAGAISTSADYTYDVNGNATKDRSGMNFRYNHLNLPDSVYNSTVRVGYLYDATGIRLRKYSNQGGNRDYVGGIEYGSSGIELIHAGVGFVARNVSNNSYSYRYNLTDHLGNVRATVYRNPATNAIEILQKDDYYPFGKQYVVAAGNNKYLYNGKELQSELGGQYDYGARFYDAEIGRWHVVDPMAEDFEDVSPYNYGMNNPILMVDPTGMAADTIRMQEIFINAPKREPVSGFMGVAEHIWTGGNHDGFQYNWEGKPIGFSPITGIAPTPGTTKVNLKDIQNVLKNVRNIFKSAKDLKKALPSIDATGKVHGDLPKAGDFAKYSKEELGILLKELKQSVQKRIEVTSKLGRDRGHGQRQGAEQDLIKSLEKYLR